jgi:hypothetical protein
VKAGYGTLEEVQEFDARTVLQALYYEEFLSNRDSAFIELNKRDKS